MADLVGLFRVGRDHPWSAWHGDTVRATGDGTSPDEIAGVDCMIADDPCLEHARHLSVSGPWSGVIPMDGLIPIDDRARDINRTSEGWTMRASATLIHEAIVSANRTIPGSEDWYPTRRYGSAWSVDAAKRALTGKPRPPRASPVFWPAWRAETRLHVRAFSSPIPDRRARKEDSNG